MDGVRRANGFYREGAGDSRENRVRDVNEVATTCEHLEPTCRGAFIRLTQAPGGALAEDGAGSLGKRQSGGDPLTLCAYRSFNSLMPASIGPV